MAATAILNGFKNFPPADFSCYVSKLSSCKISAFGHKNELFDSIFPLSTPAIINMDMMIPKPAYLIPCSGACIP